MTDAHVRLEIDGDLGPYEGETGVFDFRDVDSVVEEVDKSHLVGGRGTVVSELISQTTERDPTDILPGDGEPGRRAGIHVDAGGGENTFTLSAESGLDPDDQFGTGETDPTDPGDTTRLDATGSHPSAKRDVLLRWVAQTRVDSSRPARLYVSEHDDDGAFGEPIPVAINSARGEVDTETTLEATFELQRTSEVIDVLTDAAEDVVDAVGDLLPDF